MLLGIFLNVNGKMMMKHYDVSKIIFRIFVMIAIVSLGGLLYIKCFKSANVDIAQSVNGTYEALLQATSTPAWSFGSQTGKLILKKDETIISKTDFEIANDGKSMSEKNWIVSWYDDRVEIILVGEEQYDELVTLYYDGQVEHSQLTTHHDIYRENVSDDITSDLQVESSQEEKQIVDGYKAIYEIYSDYPLENFKIYYGAKFTSTKCILSENDDTIEYLVYNGKSENEKCGLYVRYQNKKDNNGTWSNANALIIDIYAYVYENDSVVSSGKTYWEDIALEAFQEVAEER